MTPISLTGPSCLRGPQGLGCPVARGRVLRRAEGGFSLFELLLVLVVLLGLLSTFVVHLDAMRHGGALNEGVIRLESLLRFARAEAALRGKRVRVEFKTAVPEEGRRREASLPEPLQLAWEPDPLQRPGEFEPLRSTPWADQPLRELLTVQEVVPTTGRLREEADDIGSMTAMGVSLREGEDSSSTAAITFDAEGCADSIELIVQATDPEDRRWIVVTLDGLTGEVTHRELSEEERLERERSGSEISTGSASVPIPSGADPSATPLARGP